MKLPAHWLPAPTVADGIVDGHGGTPLTLCWVVRHPRKAALLFIRHPYGVLKHLVRRPRRFVLGHRTRQESGSVLETGAGMAAFATEVARLLAAKNVLVFEVTNPGRIGHLAGETDLWLRERALSGGCKHLLVLAGEREEAANEHFWEYCAARFDWVVSRSAWAWLQKAAPALEAFHHCRYDYFHAYDTSAASYSVYSSWQTRRPLFELNPEDQVWLAARLSSWGLHPGDWFVCFHNREMGYSPKDDDMHAYRNARPLDQVPAMQEVVRRGGWVFRMGDPTMSPLPPMERVIDYAFSSERCPRLDVLLCAAARCVVGCSSGLSIVSTAFGVPVLTVNQAPMAIQALTSRDIGMPKLYYSETEKRVLRFDEVFASPSSNFRASHLFAQNGLRLLDNSPEEILEATVELLDELSGVAQASEEDLRRQRAFAALFQPGHFGYGSAARTSAAFLRRHKELLPAGF